jgi:hypothetical protein
MIPTGADLTKKKFGRLTVIGKTRKTSYGNSYWLCKCDCGNTKEVFGKSLINGDTKSCGCYRTEVHTKHDFSHSRLYQCYKGMKRRCYNENFHQFHRYGGRGIKVCDEWLDDPEEFLSWALENGYRDDLTLDRIDNDGDYTPSNCRWASLKEQARNTSRSIYVEVDGESKPLGEWCEIYGVNRGTAYRRLRKGKRGRDVFKSTGSA